MICFLHIFINLHSSMPFDTLACGLQCISWLKLERSSTLQTA